MCDGRSTHPALPTVPCLAHMHVSFRNLPRPPVVSRCLQHVRADEAAESHVRNRLAALHTLPTDAPVTDSDECGQLFELLTVVRMTAESREVGGGSTPTGRGSRTYARARRIA